MPTIKVQSRTATAKGKKYNQLWVGLPKAICEALGIGKGSSLEVFVERGDLILRRA